MAKKRSGPGPVAVLAVLVVLLLAGMGAALAIVLGDDPDAVARPEGPGAGTADTRPEDAPHADGGPEDAAPEVVASSNGGADASVAATLRGRLRNYRTREPVAGVALTLLVPPAAEGAKAVQLAAASEADGAFRFTGLPPRGGYLLAGALEPFAPLSRPGIDLAPSQVRDLGTIWLDLPVDLPVLVADLTGAPVAEAHVCVFATSVGAASDDEEAPDTGASGVAAPAAPTAEAQTDAAGTATVKGLLPGWYLVSATAKGHGRAGRANVLLAPDARSETLRLLLPLGHALGGRVTDAAGAPVAAARVIAAPDASRHPALESTEAATDADGRYALEGLAAGNYTLYLAQEGRSLVAGGAARVPDMERLDIRLRPTATLVGTVTDRDGGGIADAEVSYAPQSGVELSTRTGPDGSYRIEGVPSGPSQYFRVRADGFVPYPDPTVPQQGSGESVREGAEVRRDVTLEHGVRCDVTVLASPDDAPVEGATIELRMVQMWGGDGRPWSATTDESGVAKFPGVSPGTYMVMIAAPGYVQPGMPAGAQQLLGNAQAVPEAWRLDLTQDLARTYRVARGVSVRGIVRDASNQPYAGARVTVTGSAPLVPIFTDAEGKFRVDAVGASRRAVASATAPGLPSGSSEPFVVEEGRDVNDIEIKLVAGATVTGRVRSQDGSALQGAFVRWMRGQLSDGNSWQFQRFESAERFPVAADGTFTITGVPDGALTVRADADGCLPQWSRGANVESGRDVGGIDLILQPAVEMRGRVERMDGTPVVGARINANYSGESAENRSWGGFVGAIPGDPNAQSDENGQFVLRGLKPGIYWLWAAAPGNAPAWQGDVATGTGEVLLKLGRAESIAGVVLTPEGAPLGGVPVRAQPAEEARAQRGNWWGWGNQVFTAPDGAFEFQDLPEGIFDLTVSANWVWGRDANVRETTEQGVRTGRTDVEIRVQAGNVIAGRVLDLQDHPVTNGWINAVPESGGNNWQSQRWARIAADGSFKISGLAPGAHTVSVYGSFIGEPARGVPTGSDNVELRVRSGLTICGYVVDTRGIALAQGFNLQTRKAGTEQWQWSQVFAPGDGSFVVVGLEDGSYDLKFQASPWAPAEFAAVRAGETALEVVMREGREIAGSVVNARGEPVRASVQAYQINVPGGATPAQSSARADGSGVFTLVGLPDGDYRLNVRASGYAPAALGNVRAGAAGLRIVLEEGVNVSGTCKWENGDAVENARLQLAGEDGSAVAWARVAGDGTFTFEHVPSDGTWTLSGNWWGNGRSTTIRHEGEVRSGATDVAVVVR